MASVGYHDQRGFHRNTGHRSRSRRHHRPLLGKRVRVARVYRQWRSGVEEEAILIAYHRMARLPGASRTIGYPVDAAWGALIAYSIPA